MRISHRIGVTKEERKAFLKLGVDLPVSTSHLVSTVFIVISEDDPLWPNIFKLLKKLGKSSFPETSFSREELNSAQYLAVQPSWHHGYPQPEDDNEYMNVTYDLKEYCKSCAVGAQQKGPFRIKGHPRWGRRSLLQLNWVFDEYFVTPKVWAAVFRPLGIKSSPVFKKDGSVIDSVVQLQIPELVDLEMGNHPFVECPACHKRNMTRRWSDFFCHCRPPRVRFCLSRLSTLAVEAALSVLSSVQ